MTRGAAGRQPEMRPLRGRRARGGHLPVRNVRRVVARPAFQRPVLAHQLEPGQPVVERLRVPAYERKLPPVMLLVALNARLRPEGRMIPLPRPHALPELRVTREAPGLFHRFAERVAGGAVPQTLQGCVRSGKLSRRNLRPGIGPPGNYQHPEKEPYGAATLHLKYPPVSERDRNADMDQEDDQHDDAERKMDHVPEREKRAESCKERNAPR